MFICVPFESSGYAVGQACILTLKEDAAGEMKYSLPYKGRCLCQIVLNPRNIMSNCQVMDEEDVFWFTNDSDILTQRANWTPEKLDILLERNGYCGKIY